MNAKSSYFNGLRASMSNLVKFHLGWNVAGLALTLLIGLLFHPARSAAAGIAEMNMTSALIARLPDNMLLWVMMLVVVFIGRRYAAFLAATAMGKTTLDMPAQARANDGNGSPTILRKAYMKGLAVMLIKVALMSFTTTVYMLAIRFFLYNLALVLFSVWLVRANTGIRFLEEWKALYRGSDTDDATREVDTAAFLAGAIGFLIP